MHSRIASSLALFCLMLMLSGCAWFVTHYDAGAYQNFTNLKAFHVKFIEDSVIDPKASEVSIRQKLNEIKVECNKGELKFREAREYALGKQDNTRVDAISYLYNDFANRCGKLSGAIDENNNVNSDGLKPFSKIVAKELIPVVEMNYDLAIKGEFVRIGGPK